MKYACDRASANPWRALSSSRAVGGRARRGRLHGFFRQRGGPMTEADWLTCTEPLRLLHFLGSRASARKLRLFAAACCRRASGLLADGRFRAVIEAIRKAGFLVVFSGKP